MIKKAEPLSMAEVSELVGKESEKAEQIKNFIKTFIKITPKDAKALREELRGLDMIKLKEEHMVKVVDFLPQDAEDLIKVLNTVSLTQDEITKILEIVRKY